MWSRDFRFGNHCPGARCDVTTHLFFMMMLTPRDVREWGSHWFPRHPLNSSTDDGKVQETKMRRFSGIVCNMNLASDNQIRIFFIESFPPRHATVDGKVERIWKADEHVDEEDYLVRQLVVKELNQTEIYSLSIHLVLPSNHFNNYCL